MRHHSLVQSLGSTDDLLVQLIGLAAGIGWTVVYILIIVRAFKDKTTGMPFAAMCANVMWEAMFLFLFTPADTEDLIIDALWFILDCIIVLTWLKFWRVDWPKQVPEQLAFPNLILCLAIALGILVGMQLEFGNPRGGEIASFGQNLMMSVLFLMMLIRRQSTSGQSVAIAVGKFISTLCASLYFWLNGSTTLMWVSLYLSIAIFDVIYILALRSMSANERALRPSTASA